MGWVRFIAACLLMLSSACAAADHEAAPDQSFREVAADRHNGSAGIYPTIDPEAVVYSAPLALTGTVTQVEGPFWNQASGQKWEDSGSYTVPYMYREIRLAVTETLRNDFDVDVSGDFVFIAIGGGETATGDAPFIGGHFNVDDEVIVFLSSQVLYMREQPIVVYQPHYFNQGVFHSRRGLAIADQRLDGLDVAPDAESAVQPGAPGQPVEAFLDLVRSGRGADIPAWNPYRPSEMVAYEEVATIMRYLETGQLPVSPGS